MSTEARPIKEPPVPVDSPLPLQDLGPLLVKHYGLNEGLFDLMIEYQFGTGAVGPDKDHLVPGVMIGVARVGLVPVGKIGPNTVNASEVNPPAKGRRKT